MLTVQVILNNNLNFEDTFVIENKYWKSRRFFSINLLFSLVVQYIYIYI